MHPNLSDGESRSGRACFGVPKLLNSYTFTNQKNKDTMAATMKVSICMLLVAFSACRQPSIPVGDTSRNALDWPGTYHGIIPCADCPGILTTIRLNSDDTYVMYTTYLERDGSGRQESGAFTWDQSESK
ncbi:MAG TPA: copper resistance protein NlpE, partial [Chitinophagaceae bacterium]|nr:copper resistance protein NlpE [Chitinophagaceae bacterium]